MTMIFIRSIISLLFVKFNDIMERMKIWPNFGGDDYGRFTKEQRKD